MLSLIQALSEAASRLSDAELARELERAQRHAACSTRAWREVALLRVRCLRGELARRADSSSAVLKQPNETQNVARA